MQLRLGGARRDHIDLFKARSHHSFCELIVHELLFVGGDVITTQLDTPWMRRVMTSRSAYMNQWLPSNVIQHIFSGWDEQFPL
jgi:hypothetical protein